MIGRNILKNLLNKLHITQPVIFMIILFFVANFWAMLYAVYERSLPPTYGLLYFIAISWLIGWWLKEDRIKYQEKWIYDIGFLLYAGWFIVIPFYLFRTRGIKAFISFFKFGVIYFGTIFIGIILSLFIKIIYPG